MDIEANSGKALVWANYVYVMLPTSVGHSSDTLMYPYIFMQSSSSSSPFYIGVHLLFLFFFILGTNLYKNNTLPLELIGKGSRKTNCHNNMYFIVIVGTFIHIGFEEW
jgi:hypothetical protein